MTGKRVFTPEQIRIRRERSRRWRVANPEYRTPEGLERRHKRQCWQRRVANMTPEQREKRRAARQASSGLEMERRRPRRRVANMTQEQIEQRRHKRRVTNMTAERREQRKLSYLRSKTPEKREQQREATRRWREKATEPTAEQREHLNSIARERQRERYQTNPMIRARKLASHRIANMTPEKRNHRRRWHRQWRKERMATDIISATLKGRYRAGSVVLDLGCTIEEFKEYIQRMFQPGMTWENWSRTGWHLDHIRPLSSFNLMDRTNFLQAVHFSNYQPLWAFDNLSKGGRLTHIHYPPNPAMI